MFVPGIGTSCHVKPVTRQIFFGCHPKLMSMKSHIQKEESSKRLSCEPEYKASRSRRRILPESNMSTSSSESSQTSESAPESPREPPISSTNMRKPPVSKTKQDEAEESIGAETESPSPKSKDRDVKSAFLGTQGNSMSITKKPPVLLAISLSILFLIYWFVRSVQIANSGSKEKGIAPVEFLGENAIEFESVVQKLRDRVEAFEEATKLVEEKMDFLKEKLARIDSNNSATRATLENLELQVSEFNRSLSALGNSSRDDLFNCVNGTALSEKLTVISDFMRGVIEEEIEKHEADGIGKVDYALASGGATILSHSEPQFPVNEHDHLVHPDAIKMLQPSFGEPGQCFSLKGNSGHVEIRLRTEIFPESLSLEHVSHRTAYNMSSAPKDCNVTGWLESNYSTSATAENNITVVHQLVSFKYDIEKRKNIQTFEVEKSSNCSEGLVVNVVRFEFTSNYGDDHTCIHRFRVHGHEARGAFGRARKRPSSSTKISLDRSLVLLVMFVFLSI